MEDAMKDPNLFDRYAPDVIGAHPEYFDAIEINGVRSLGQGDVEVDNEEPDAFSVYLHYKPDEEAGRVGVQCCGDFAKREQAQQYAEELRQQYGWPVLDFTLNAPERELPCDRMTDYVLLEALQESNLENTVTYIQDVTGITDLETANFVLDAVRENWPSRTLSQRMQILEMWRTAERNLRVDYPQPADEAEQKAQLYFAIILAGIRHLQLSFMNEDHVVEEIQGILFEGGIELGTPEQRQQLIEDIDALAEAIQTDNLQLMLAAPADED